MNKELYDKYLNLLRKLKKDRPEWTKHPNAWIEDMYHSEKGPFFDALKSLSDDVVSCLESTDMPQNRHEANALFESVVDYVAQRAEDISSIRFTYGAAEFITKLYMDYFGYPQTDTSVDDLDENVIDESVLLFDSDISLAGDACRQTLVEYQNRLKNLSRNNRLVNFKQQKNAMLSFCYPSTRNLFKMLLEGKTLTIVNWERAGLKQILRCRNPECGKYMFRKYIAKSSNQLEYCPICDSINGKSKHMAPLEEKPFFSVEQEMVVNCVGCGEQVRLPTELFESKTAESIVCPICGEGLIKSYPFVFLKGLKEKRIMNDNSAFLDFGRALDVAHKLISRDKNMQKNFGLRALYMAFGFLNWSDVTGLTYRSPLLLLRVILYQDANKNYCLAVDGDASEAVSINKTLEYILGHYSRDLSFTIPSYEKEEFGAYLHRVKKEIAKFNLEWTVEEAAVLGLFNHQKSQLEEEIKGYFDEYLANPFINRICGGVRSLPSCTFIHGGEFSICDADASQQLVIDEAISGESFVLQGPPGSGKSQTITNLITEFIARGKTVLFVTQKSTAREIICSNMRERSVGDNSLIDYCLNFDALTSSANGITKKSFKDHMNEIFGKMLNIDPVIDANNESNEAEIEELRNQLFGNRDKYLVEVNGSKASIMQIIDVFMRYAEEENLDLLGGIPTSRLSIDFLNHAVEKFYGYLPEGYLNFKAHPLYGYREQDYSAPSLSNMMDVIQYFEKIKQIYKTCTELGLESAHISCPRDLKGLLLLADSLEQAVLLPIFERSWLREQNRREWSKKLLKKTARIKQFAEELRERRRKIMDYGLADEALALNVEEYRTFLKKKKLILFHFGKAYKSCVKNLAKCKSNPPFEINYKAALNILDQIEQYQAFQRDVSKFKTEAEENCFDNDVALGIDYDWETLHNRIFTIVQFYENIHDSKYFNDRLFELLTGSTHDDTVRRLSHIAQEINTIYAELKTNLISLQSKFDQKIFDFDCISFDELAEIFKKVLRNKHLLTSWIRFNIYYDEIKNNAQLLHIIEVLISKNVEEASRAKGALLRNYWMKFLNEILSQPQFISLNSFSRTVFERILQQFRLGDKASIKNAVRRVYSTLQNRKIGTLESMQIAHGDGAKFFKQKDAASIRDLISSNWKILSTVKPCFMMSPLSVAQYIDPSLRFDLVVFDESSQIFVEDALAAIFRGKQVVIAGDLQQLPPVNFFRAGVQRGEEEESAHFVNVSCSLLNEAQKMLEKNYALRWHYRSYDEELITFSNRHFYNNCLITFPTAVKVETDGIFGKYIPYNVNGCYESGKGQHINRNEALWIIERIKEEICNFPDYSVGIVAFSAAQAEYIEKIWLDFCSTNDGRALTEKWVFQHKKEPLVICNLDSIQGDERDTILISTCYGRDKSGNFNLLTLGPLMNDGGKNRLNVAITRSRHRMIVVTSMRHAQLEALLSASKGQHIEGAKILCEFLEYVESTEGSKSRFKYEESVAGLEKQICTLLSDNGIAYARKIGDSECKIDVAVCTEKSGAYKLGIVLEATMNSAKSVREYARLRDEMLEKHGWHLYHIWAMDWFRDFGGECKRLIDYIRDLNFHT